MLASTHFGITRTRADDWFDAILDHDTEIFIDPFLIFKEKRPLWRGAHRKIIRHFDRAFHLVATGNRNPRSLAYRKAVDQLVFREPSELCLGYTSEGTSGSGTSKGFARRIAAAISTAIGRGLIHPSHFEELGIIEEGIGADRISDITATILKPDLIRYTQAIARRHGIEMDRHTLFAAGFDEGRGRWDTGSVPLPTNPVTGGPLLLVPQRFLRPLPTLNADDWWNWYENEQLRTDLNYEVMGNVNKKTIVEAARRNPEAVRRWIAQHERKPATPYDLHKDPRGVWQWDPLTAEYVAQNPLTLDAPSSDAGFTRVIQSVVDQFRHFVEEQGGWDLLWKDHRLGQEKPESAAQLLFRGIAQNHCWANNISLDREVELGRGPVDFKFSNGYQKRALLEVKKLHNGKFWDGVHAQLPSYLKSEQCRTGWLLAIHMRESKSSKLRARDLPGEVQAAAKTHSLTLRYSLVDARPRPSASKLKRQR